jgi:hypothetical protein
MPKSRGGLSTIDNLVILTRREHETYHALFDNRTPVEVVDYLTRTFFKNKWEYVQQALDNYNGTR